MELWGSEITAAAPPMALPWVALTGGDVHVLGMVSPWFPFAIHVHGAIEPLRLLPRPALAVFLAVKGQELRRRRNATADYVGKTGEEEDRA